MPRRKTGKETEYTPHISVMDICPICGRFYTVGKIVELPYELAIKKKKQYSRMCRYCVIHVSIGGIGYEER